MVVCVCVRASQPFLFARARVSECACVCVRMCVCCSFHGGACASFVSVSLCVRARAFVCVRGTLCGFAVPSASIFAHVLRVCVHARAARLRVYASWLGGRCGRPAATCGPNSSAGGAGRPRVRGCGSVRSALGVARVRPQVRRGRAARPARRGLRETGTRRWSTPPAPSTSSAASAESAGAVATSRTCGSAPTEVRGRTRSGGRSGGRLGGYSGGTHGYQGVRGY